MNKWLLVLVCAFGLTGCLQSTVPTQNLPEITFQHLQPIALNVASIEVVDESKSGTVGTHVEHLFPTSPKTAVKNWAHDRLSATGSSGLARLIINDASAVEEKLKKTTGVKGVFTNDQSERYTVNVDTVLQLFDENANLIGTASAKSSRFKTIAEDASLLDREKSWFDLVEKTMKDFDSSMIANMNSRLGAR